MTSTNNKRIAKNTIYLYIRTIITLLISLYTSRIFLEVLGVIDLGIYNVVGGIVVMLSFLNTMMAAGTQRFLSYELGGNNDPKQLKKLFSILFFIHVLVAIVLFILAETIGLWLFYNKLIIPQERLTAAMWVFQFSVLSAIVTITQVPYNASIIAHEKMNVFAYITIVQTFAKLLVVYAIMLIDYDKLKLIAILNFSIILTTTFVYRSYCERKFQECILKFHWDTSLFKSLISYSSWNLFGAFSNVVADQGINVLSNLFFGPTVNASRAISFQIKSALTSFVSNFQTAVNPQIIKSYASKDYEYMKTLIMGTAKYSFLLLLFFAFPIILETKYILKLWLGTIPEYSVTFCKLILISACIDCLSGPLVTAVQATGRIKIYQITVGVVLMLTFPISYVILLLIQVPESPFYVSIFISFLLIVIRIVLLERVIRLSLLTCYKQIGSRLLLVLIPPLLCSMAVFLLIDEGFNRFLVNIFVSAISILPSAYFIGLTKIERKCIKDYVVKKLVNKKKTKV
ncbi:MATE family efflux transporter [Bacteroides timonensis]|uniref:hypothetical protein n=1 Tax=Bacteroides timonensis TaxID=1470345 RepID=UPI0004BBED68|nr:hypothetical protein [Bacteroides timonensis]